MKKKRHSQQERQALRQQRNFSEALKRRIVKEIEDQQVTVSEVCRLYAVSGTSVYKWIHKYSRRLEKGVRQVVELESESTRTKKLAERVAELERVIGQKQLEIDYLEKVVEIGSEEIGLDLKKKCDTLCSNGSASTDSSTDTP